MQFYNPLFLYGLFAILIPLIIHLFNFKRFKKVYFTNLAFLKDVQQQTKRHSQWRHLVIMFLRMLAIATMVIAFAGPYIPNKNATKNQSDIAFVNVFLDNSFSMEARGSEGSLFEQARLISRQIALSYKASDRFRLLTNSQYSFARNYVSRDMFIQQLDNVAIGKASMDFNVIPKQIIDDDDAHKYQYLYLISDFQKKQTNMDKWKNDSTLSISLMPLMAANQGNVFVDTLWVQSPVLQAKQSFDIGFKVSNQSDKVLEDLPVTLFLHNKQKAVLSVNIEPYSTTEAHFNIRVDSAAFYDAKINIQDYPVVYDDDFYFSFHVQNAIDVLCISSENANADITVFLKSDSMFNADYVSENAINFNNFAEYSTIVLNALSSYSSGLLNELQRYTQRGGSVVIIPSKSNTVDEINKVYGLFNLPKVNAIENTKHQIKSLDLLSDEFSDIFELKNKKQLNENTNLPFFSLNFVANARANANSKILIKNDISNPILISKAMNGSRIYAFYSSIDADNSNFSAHAVFVPIMFNLFRHNAANRYYNYLAQNQEQSFVYTKDITNGKIIMQHISDSIEFIPQYRSNQAQLYLSYQQRPNEVGAYRLLINDELIALPSFNYNRSESFLEYYNHQNINELIEVNSLDNVSIIDLEIADANTKIKEAKDGNKLWKLFIILTIVFLVFEVFLLRFKK